MIIKKALKPTNIFFLQDKKVLYTCDFRAISESMDYSIPAMWKYENLLPWLLKDQYVTANSDYKKIEYAESNAIHEVKKTKNPKISVYEKLNKIKLSDGINKLWVAIPHPKADEFAKDRKLKLNYSYKDFITKNNKAKQKKLLGTLTPSWQEIKSLEHLNELIDSNKSGFVKRKHGSGGYTVFDIKDVKNNKDFNNLFEQTAKDWFFEEKIDGKCYSIQCVKYKNKKDITIFGYSEQIIADGKYFMGSKIVNLDSLEPKIFDQLKKALTKLLPLISSFEGFFGIDFIVNKNGKLFVLEANIRLTAATIPTLLVNICGVESAIFNEDYKIDDLSEDDLIIGYDTADNLVDVICK